MKYIQREIEAEIALYLERPEALAITGPRQAGKTTLLQSIIEKYTQQGKKAIYITFEDSKALRLFEDIDAFAKWYSKFDVICIDEFQYAKEGGKKLKYLYDQYKKKYIVTGSSSLELHFKLGSFMVGRLVSFLLTPFSYREYLVATSPDLQAALPPPQDPFIESEVYSVGEEIRRRLLEQFELYLQFGGYPAIVLAQTEAQKKKLLESLMNTYVLNDVSRLLKKTDQLGMDKLAVLLAGQVGNLINYHELSVSSSLSVYELKKYLYILEKTFLFEIIRPYMKDRRSEIVKNPKLYMFDMGFHNMIMHDFRSLTQRQNGGSLVENYAYCALRRRGYWPVWFWRTKNGAEVDFVIEIESKPIPIEVKYSSHVVIGKSMYSFIEKYRPNKAFIITKDITKEVEIGATKLHFIPIWTL